jgi:hypothetical protein
MSAFGSGPSNGQFWYGSQTNFPGFLYKKNVGVGGRRSTKMGPGGNITCNSATDLYNKYKPGTGGVGASSTANRRAKNRLATICNGTNKCFPCYNTLGQYSNYTHNPNGFVPCPGTINIISSSGSVTPTPGPGPSGTYTVTYLGNTNTGGSAPTDTNSPYTGGSSVTILGVNTLVKSQPGTPPTNYQFAGWNTLADGTGLNYVGGDAFTINANTTLYANWIIGGVRLVYNAGTGGSGTAPSSSGTFYTAFSAADVVGNTGSFTNSSGYTFGGWNTAADGSGTSYPAGSEYTMPGAGTVNLYAQWINPATTYTLTYNAGTGGSGTAPTGSPTTYSSNSTATILGNTGPYTNSTSPTFYGWNTAADGSGTSYPAGSTITMNANKTLYAQWGSPPLLTVTYDANTPSGATTSGSVPAPPTPYPTNVQVPILGQGSLITPGYTFLGWNESQTGAGTGYPIGYTFTSKTTTLYAQWAPGKVLKNCGTGTGGGSYLKYNTLYNTTITDLTTTTIYAMRVYGGTLATIGSGDAPYGIYSFVSKTVITNLTTTVNVYTTFINPANNYIYSKTITNGTGVTYWPSGQTLSSITFPPFPGPSDPQDNNILPNMSILTQRITPGGCGTGGGSGTPTGGGFIDYVALINTIILNFSDNVSSSTFAACHNYTGYSAVSNPTSGPWTNAINSYYPYNTIVEAPQSYDVITILTITPSFGAQPQYVYPPLPDVTIEYYANGATSGMPPGPQYSYNPIVTPITLRSNNSAPSSSSPLVKTSSIFSGWNITPTSSPTPTYAAGATYSGTTSLKLYANWI